MMKKIISRKKLREKLQQWQEGRITAPELNDWAGRNYPSDKIDYEDWDEAGGIQSQMRYLLHWT